VITQDVRYAFRSLARAPGFTLVAVITLALGIGGTTAIFSVVDGILLRPLPYPEPQSIVSVFRASPAGERGSFSAADYLDYRRSSRSFSAIAGYRQDVVNLTGGAEPVRLEALETTGGFFDVFGLPPVQGRTYSEKSTPPTGARVAVIAERVWHQHLGSDPDVIGSTLRLNGVPTTIIGMMPVGFVHPAESDLWILAPREVPTSPLPVEGDPLAEREVQYFNAIARLAPGVTVDQANAELRTISDRLARDHPDTNEGESTTVASYHESLVGDVRAGLVVLFGAVAFVLLIACANVAGLLLARGAARRREFAVRSALGAGQGRLIRQLLTESLVLAFAGGLAGVIVAYWGVDALTALAPESIPRLDDVQLDRRVVLFGVLATGCVGLLFGSVPAFHAARRGVTETLKDGGRGGTVRTRLQKSFVVAEIALALVLLIAAGLMLTSFARLRAVDLGFSVSNLISIGVPLPQARYNAAAQARFYTDLHERLRANPVTAHSAIVFPAPFTGGNAVAGYHVEGTARVRRSERGQAQLSAVTPGYFETMGIPLLRGRDVQLSDTRDRRGVIVINTAMAEREWPAQDPIGRRIGLGANPPDDERQWMTVIGVVADSKRGDLEDAQPAAIFLPHNQFTLPFMAVMVRSTSTVEAIAAAVREATRGLDSELPLGDIELVERMLERTTGQPRFRALLITAFAGVALLLAGVGLYGLISYTVAQRVPEIGVRLALGATPLQVGRLIVGQGIWLAAAGVAAGLVAAVGATRLLKGLLFSVSATDPVVYGALAALLLTIATLACYVPARRAMRVDPMTALRAE
jgi:putative ABC transport system permease protein